MNRIKKSITVSIIALSLVAPFTFGCTSNISKTKKVIATEVTEKRNATGFKGIKASNGVVVYITPGTSEAVSVTANQDDIKRLRTEVKEGVLEIYVANKISSWFNWKGENETYKVYVTAKEINSVVTSSGANIFSTSKIKTDKLIAQASSGSFIKFESESNDLNCESSSGAQMELIGGTKSSIIHTSSGSYINASNYITETCTARSSSGSKMDINVVKQLDAEASSGGRIIYKGNPSNINQNTTSGGEVARN
ncbi:DUF2807 domain-containing protein [Solitalea sp. MAHUQ-68]|uniref:DUF2807 domain-containing protein n=1 Tax=Solitalea agri TaxID=2953739 RepID=A0A9X2F5M1_9SPHI|nr:head GIN domain-containing protein [Solitalea agri]MCO4291253.1 DUF2807 domain-containing protein [Solitalea agri]